MTLDQIKQTSSYEALKRNGLDDDNIVQFYSLPNGQRGAFLSSFKSGTVAPKAVENLGTQKCTSVSVARVRGMALEYMNKTWEYRGQTYNLSDLGWTFEFHTKKRSNGTCWGSKKKIYLSSWVVENSDREMSGWINTMVHEIAHAINHIKGGRGHDNQWRDIFLSFGGSGERCSKDKFNVDATSSKYTLECGSCGAKHPSHKKKKRPSACASCCNKYNGGKYSVNYILKQVQNY